MEQRLTETAAEGREVLKFAASAVWRLKWLIVVACLAAAAAVFLSYGTAAVPVWTGKVILRIGMAPSIEHILDESGLGPIPIEALIPTDSPREAVARRSEALAPIELQREVVERISDPSFRSSVVNEAQFEPATSEISRSLAFSSLRAVALEGRRDLTAEVTAGSRADVEAILKVLAHRIEEVHGAILEGRTRLIRAAIEDAQSRIAVIEKSSEDLRQSIVQGNGALAGLTVLIPGLPASVRVWNQLKDQIRLNTNLLAFTENTTMRYQPGAYPIASRSIEPLKVSILVGLAMLGFMIVLAMFLVPSRRTSDPQMHNQGL